MKYTLEFDGMKRHGYLSEKKRGSVEFDNVQQAQEFCDDPCKMLDKFDADCGEFILWTDEWDVVWMLRYDFERVNILPMDYRTWRDAIFAVGC